MKPQTLNQKVASQLLNYCAHELALFDHQPPEAFDALARLAARLFDVPVALISIIDEEGDRQFFVGKHGLAQPWSDARQTPLSHSFCQHVKSQNAPLLVKNARRHPQVKDNLAIEDLGVVSYLGVPIKAPGGDAIGALCVIQDSERCWTSTETELLEDLAICVNDEILLRASLVANSKAQERLQRFNALRETITMAFMAPDLSVDARFTELLRAGCKALGADSGIISQSSGGMEKVMFSAYSDLPQELSWAKPTPPSLSSIVRRGQEIVFFSDLDASTAKGWRNQLGNVPGTYVGAPLILNGVLFGVLEFSSAAARMRPWDEEELNVVSIIALFASAHLEIYGEIIKLKRLETGLSAL